MQYMHTTEIPEAPSGVNTLEKLVVQGDSFWVFDFKDHMFGLDSKPFVELDIKPEKGDLIETWGGLGRAIRGVAVNGRVVVYRTEEQQQDWEQKKHQEEYRKNLKAFLDGEKDLRDARIAALPAVFQERFAGYHKAGGEQWRVDYESYELYCCEQAVACVEHLKTEESIRAFASMSYKEQVEAWPQMDKDHSGNTFGHTVRLAVLYLTHPELIPKVQSGISPLIGSEAAHDWCTRPEAQAEIEAAKSEEENPE